MRSLDFSQIVFVGKILSLPIQWLLAIDNIWVPIQCSYVDWISINCQWNANWLPIECLLTNNQMPINIQSCANWLPIEFQLTSNLLYTKLNANWQQIRCLSNLVPIDSQSDANWHPIYCQLTPNGHLIWCWFTANKVPINFQFISNWHPI